MQISGKLQRIKFFFLKNRIGKLTESTLHNIIKNNVKSSFKSKVDASDHRFYTRFYPYVTKTVAIDLGTFAYGSKLFIILNLIFASVTLNAQEKWVSSTNGYTLEIPEGFSLQLAAGKNVDFKAGKGNSSIVIVVKTLPKEYNHLDIWQIMGDLSTYETEWEKGAREYLDTPDFLKYGKGEINGHDTFWYDYTTANPKSYSKVYQLQKAGKIFTYTLTSSYESRHASAPVWYRFKNEIKFQ
jgi:hypothetical protein